MSFRRLALVAIFTALSGSSVQAQSCVGRPDFDACMSQMLGQQQQQLDAASIQLWNNYLAEYGPWLQQQYAQYQGPPLSFEEFAYWMLITANGTDFQTALRTQKETFEANMRAHATVMQGYDDYNRGMIDNSKRSIDAIEGFDQGAVRGNSTVVDAITGQTVELPYSDLAYDQPFSVGNSTYVLTREGYYQWTGNDWIPMQVAR